MAMAVHRLAEAAGLGENLAVAVDNPDARRRVDLARFPIVRARLAALGLSLLAGVLFSLILAGLVLLFAQR